jgi:cytochrome d ubiquinol oxidase subunit II
MVDLIEPFLADIWLFLIGFFLLYYAITDGSDLGVGIISLFSKEEEERALLMASIRNTWHGNQTWLVILGGMLFGAFPLFYGLVLSALYIPIVIMLFGLVFRGVSFEFHEYARHKIDWGLSFSLGSLIATLGQGFALGGLLSGLHIENRQFVGSVWGWMNPFSLVITAGVVLGYIMLGANYLIMKTENELQHRSYRISLVSSLCTAAVSVVVHVWTIYRYPAVLRKWSAMPDVFYVAAFPFLAVVAFFMLLLSLWRHREVAPTIWNAVIVLFSFIGLSISMYPGMIPQVVSPAITVGDAAASPPTLMFMLVVTAVLIPVILTYTAYEFWVFHGKVEKGGYSGEQQ